MNASPAGRASSTWYCFLPGRYLHFWAGLQTGINHYQLVRPYYNINKRKVLVLRCEKMREGPLNKGIFPFS